MGPGRLGEIDRLLTGGKEIPYAGTRQNLRLPRSYRLWSQMIQADGTKRVVIDHVGPQIDCGRFPIKRAAGETVTVVVYAFADGHDQIRVELLYRKSTQSDWLIRPMAFEVNDEWAATFVAAELGTYLYTARAWVDHFGTWRTDLQKRRDAGQEVVIDLRVGAGILRAAAERAEPPDAGRLTQWADLLQTPGNIDDATALALGEELSGVMQRYSDRSQATTYPTELAVMVDRPKAVFSTWYELFPRSFGPGGRHGTLRDCERLLPEIAALGFDVLYLPPIHPIGQTHRKGRNNTTQATPDDPGSPWAIGSAAGGHKAIHPQLGSFDDFRALRQKAGEHGLEIALDLAFQCSPDHPYVSAHPEWFRWRPDGTVQFAENPPKRYQDIIPLNFETGHWPALWEELKSIVLFWIGEGIRIFRVDNPHTKPFAFWQWLLGEIRRDYPDVIFLCEAFTRPKVMERLAKLGFNQSYTYFAWRNTKGELEQYLRELMQTPVVEYLRPHFWPNTPDILPQYLQYGGRPAFIVRLILAATLSASYGIYGPAFELGVREALEGSEEYLNAEKYELKQWDWNAKGNLRPVIERVNRIRRQNAALQSTRNLQLYTIDNEAILCYGKMTADKANIVVTAVNTDPYHRQSGWLRLPLQELEIDPRKPFLAHELLTDDKYIWQGEVNYIELDPQVMPAHILRLHKGLRRETDFDYFL